MRRLLTANLLVVFLAPWIAALSGKLVLGVPCPMHRAGVAESHEHANGIAAGQHEAAEHQSSSHHGTTARGCNCAGECGRSGAPFSLPARDFVVALSGVIPGRIAASEQPGFGAATLLLPPATGPPQRLRI